MKQPEKEIVLKGKYSFTGALRTKSPFYLCFFSFLSYELKARGVDFYITTRQTFEWEVLS
jgi:hypothetical protein